MGALRNIKRGFRPKREPVNFVVTVGFVVEISVVHVDQVNEEDGFAGKHDGNTP